MLKQLIILRHDVYKPTAGLRVCIGTGITSQKQYIVTSNKSITIMVNCRCWLFVLEQLMWVTPGTFGRPTKTSPFLLTFVIILLEE